MEGAPVDLLHERRGVQLYLSDGYGAAIPWLSR